jgi:hypothetical protein
MSHKTKAPSLAREADERAFAETKKEIIHRFVVHVRHYGGVDPIKGVVCPDSEKVRPTMEEARRYVDHHIDELWCKIPIPDELRYKYEELEDRLVEPRSDSPAVAKPPGTTYRKKNVNARMLETMAKDQNCIGWTCSQWATHLKCAKSSIVATDAWKMLEQRRLQLKAEKAKDRRGYGVGRRRGEYGDR